MKHTIFFCLGIFILGCTVHQRIEVCNPVVCVPETFAFGEGKGVDFDEWWRQFNSEGLNKTVEIVLQNNLDLKQSWYKVVQACYQSRIVGSARWPEINLDANATRFKSAFSSVGTSGIDTGTGTATGFGAGGGNEITFYQLSTMLTYEVDLWRRIDSQARAACLEWKATREDLEAAALTITGTVVDLWFTIQEQKTLLEVIDYQIDVSKTLLELVELRFSVGESTALDVYQQRLQLAATIAEKPPIQSRLQTAINEMYTLMGCPPESGEYDISGELVDLPPMPDIRTPAALLVYRPDLRAQQRRLLAADYEVAAAIADRLPRLNLSLEYGFEALELKKLFDGEAWSIVENLTQPIFDAGRRKAEVGRRKAIVCELLNSYGNTFLTAVREIEDALVEEKYQLDLIGQIGGQIDLAEANLEEARFNYIYGLVDYLTVIAAVQSLQDLQRQLVSANKNLLVIRARLYRALGGPYLL